MAMVPVGPGSELDPKSTTEIWKVIGEKGLTVLHLEVWMQSLQGCGQFQFSALGCFCFRAPLCAFPFPSELSASQSSALQPFGFASQSGFRQAMLIINTSQ